MNRSRRALSLVMPMFLRNSKTLWKLRRLAADEQGQATLEWALVLAFVVLPMYFVFKVLMDVLVGHYQMVTFMHTLPFP